MASRSQTGRPWEQVLDPIAEGARHVHRAAETAGALTSLMLDQDTIQDRLTLQLAWDAIEDKHPRCPDPPESALWDGLDHHTAISGLLDAVEAGEDGPLTELALGVLERLARPEDVDLILPRILDAGRMPNHPAYAAGTTLLERLAELDPEAVRPVHQTLWKSELWRDRYRAAGLIGMTGRGQAFVEDLAALRALIDGASEHQLAQLFELALPRFRELDQATREEVEALGELLDGLAGDRGAPSEMCGEIAGHAASIARSLARRGAAPSVVASLLDPFGHRGCTSGEPEPWRASILQAYLDLGLHAQAIRPAEIALEQAEQRYAETPGGETAKELSWAHRRLALAQRGAEQLYDALVHIVDAIHYGERQALEAGVSAEQVNAYSNHVRCELLIDAGEPGQAAALAASSIEALEQAHTTDDRFDPSAIPLAVSRLLTSQARAEAELGQLAPARHHYQAAIGHLNEAGAKNDRSGAEVRAAANAALSNLQGIGERAEA